MNYGSVSFNPGSTCDAEGLAATVALALGLSLGRAGIDAVALPVIEKALRHAPELAADDILTASLELFLGRASAAQCLELGLWLLELTGPVPWLCAQPLVVHGIRVLPADPAGTARRLTAAYHECAARLREEGDRETAGRAHFNLAAALRHLGCLSEAVIEFAAAQELRPEYSNEPRFRRMLGGALWDLGDYCDAADEYEAGIRCSTTGDEDLVPLWADALFAAGEFGQSSDAMRDWVPGPGHVELGVIVGCISDLVVNVVGLRSQHRNPLAPGELDEALIAVLADGAMPPREQAWPALLTLLREQDAADPRLWTLASEVLEQPTRASGLLLVAHVVHSSAMIWTEAVRDLDEAGLTEVRDAAIVSALRRCGAEFLESSEGGAEPLDPVLISRVHELSVLLVDELPTATDDGFYEIDPPPLTLPGAD
jgi:tetratricopeptide (TPR) repeat protein